MGAEFHLREDEAQLGTQSSSRCGIDGSEPNVITTSSLPKCPATKSESVRDRSHV